MRIELDDVAGLGESWPGSGWATSLSPNCEVGAVRVGHLVDTGAAGGAWSGRRVGAAGPLSDQFGGDGHLAPFRQSASSRRRGSRVACLVSKRGDRPAVAGGRALRRVEAATLNCRARHVVADGKAADAGGQLQGVAEMVEGRRSGRLEVAEVSQFFRPATGSRPRAGTSTWSPSSISPARIAPASADVAEAGRLLGPNSMNAAGSPSLGDQRRWPGGS